MYYRNIKYKSYYIEVYLSILLVLLFYILKIKDGGRWRCSGFPLIETKNSHSYLHLLPTLLGTHC